MENLVDGVGAFDNMSYTLISHYVSRHSLSNSPETGRLPPSPCCPEPIVVRGIDP